ncbi:nucleotidyltransferase family protein [Sphingobacterium thalpophilum]|uniref:nucleotidyltransferase family protein n=1 Tax=Sphingobacterium thalpophilum TaxID=259 RepID=UPI0024A7772B|nr:nucleotidyltransferase family protein [Sphingobacterium thalpophilum]
MNNQLKDIFFQLLRIGLWGEGRLTLTQSIDADDWNSIRKYAVNHTVEGIIYDSFPFLEEQQLPPQSLRLKWAVRMEQIERHNEKMNQVIAEQFHAFNQLGLRPILQKGQGVASCYRIPHHRLSGDIDWYFEDQGYLQARNLLKEKNIAFQDTAGFSLDYHWQGIHIEHHKKLYDIRSPLKISYLRYIHNQYQDRFDTLIIHEVPIRILAPEMQLLQVNSHILKHLLTFGIGLRQFCDSARLYFTVSTAIDPIRLRQIYKQAGILKWIHLLHKVLVEYFGLPEQAVPFPYPANIDVKWMLEEVWQSGNFGFYDDRFQNKKINSTISTRPDGPRRMWLNFKRYLRYAPQEALFFYVVHAYSKLISKNEG